MIYEVMMGSASNSFTTLDVVNGIPTQKNVTVTAPSGYGIANVVPITSNHTVELTDDTILADATSGAIVVTLPSAASRVDLRVTVKKIDSTANTVTIAVPGGQTIDGASTAVLSAQNNSVTVVTDGATKFYITQSHGY